MQKRDPKAVPVTEKDWRTEYLAPVISVATVDGVDGAIRHIATFGSQHTESIITGNEATARRFLAEVDSAIVMLALMGVPQPREMTGHSLLSEMSLPVVLAAPKATAAASD